VNINWGKVAAIALIVMGASFMVRLIRDTVMKAYEHGPILPSSASSAPAAQLIYLCVWLIFIVGIAKIVMTSLGKMRDRNPKPPDAQTGPRPVPRNEERDTRQNPFL
jgi:hypothetical protein